MKRTILAFALATAAVAAVGNAGSGSAGYLTGIDAAKFLPPPPALGSVQFAADEDVYLRMRALKGSPRWAIAAEDDKLGFDDLMRDFSCALGFTATAKTAPKLNALATKASADARFAYDSGKSYFKRPRPLVGNDLPICVDRGRYADSYSYPSGHTTLSWTFASELMALLPDRAAAIAARARAFGESRAVCGVHWASDVEAGRTAASAVFAALQSNADFRRDLDAAGKEIRALAKSAPKPDAAFCQAQEAALPRPW